MGDVVKTVFGGSEAESEVQRIPRLPPVAPRISTAAGSRLIGTPELDARGRLIGVDTTAGLAPGIAALREEGLTGIRSLIGDVQGDINTLRGLENPFIQARVSPFIEERERARRDAVRRGVAGPLLALATNPFQRQIAEQGALATAEALQARRQGQELIRGLLSDVTGAGRQLFEEELRLLGLSQDQIQQVIASQLTQPTAVTQRQESFGGVFPALFPGGL